MADSNPADTRIEQLWDEADRLLGQRSIDQAATVAEELAELLEDQPPGTRSTTRYPLHGEVIGLLAHIEWLRHHADRADALYTEALAELRRSIDTNRVPLAKALVSRSLSLIERGRNDEARAALSEAQAALGPAAERQEDGAFGGIL